MTAFTQKQTIKIKESKFQIQNQTFRTIKSIKKRKEKNERKFFLFPSQLIRLIVKLYRINPELAKLEKINFLWNKLWKKNLNSMTNIEILENSKEESVEKHQKIISKFQKNQYDNKIIIYIDKSKSETNQIGVGLIYIT